MIELCNYLHCTQCLSCVQICPKQCIQMVPSEAGFLVPQINLNFCVECEACVRSCHMLNGNIPKNSDVRVFAAWAKDDLIRTTSSSGGCFSVFAQHILQRKGVVYGAAYDKKLQLKHVRVSASSELYRIKGSKYVQSYIGEVYKEAKEYLKKGINVLFSGTPCQIAGLRYFLKKDYSNLYTIDLVCHGVPSQKAFNIYLEKIGLDVDQINSFNFRYYKGWGFNFSYTTDLGINYLALKDTYYLKAFTRGYMFMEACYSCKYANSNRIGDITLADFWGVGSKIPFRHSTRKGVSLLLVNTEKGQKLLNSCKSELFLEKRTLKEASETNHNLHAFSERPKERDSFYIDSVLLSKKNLIKKYKMKPSLRDYIRPFKRKILLLFK